ncbi:GGDEF domain-containing protein [Kozakia baliensis]|uniref:GGDEF domain-containing protein n=1 Tax=Kozakia baliensis TaxID=153496 RepID=UPI00089DCE38|nr:GGDEF domain-containing protein [Kozakia baliensis]
MIHESPTPEEESFAENDWQRLITETPAELRGVVAEIVRKYATKCIDCFYSALLSHPDATPFLSQHKVDTQLHHALINWLKLLFPIEPANPHKLIAFQHKIGTVHARSHIPIHIVLHGARLLKMEIRRHIFAPENFVPDPPATMFYVANTIDMALTFMSQSFVHDVEEYAEKEEAFRLMSLGQDMTLEREVQRSALLDWGHKTLFSICSGANLSTIPTLESSEFGIWLNHKGSVLFQGAQELKRVYKIVARIDDELMPALLLTNPPDRIILQELQASTDELRFIIDSMFKALESIEGGRDPLTNTLSRRFLPTILGREVSLALRRKMPFSLLMVDVDHFSRINEKLGHIGGDAILRNIATTLVNACRANDFIFRYGGEEFLIVLIETEKEAAIQVAEHIRSTIEHIPPLTIDGTKLPITASIGIGTFDGHPDYTHLIEDVDRALYAAKKAGRNRCSVA